MHFGTFTPLSSAPQPDIPHDQASRAMADILDTISSIQQRRDDYRRMTGGRGIDLLIKLSTEAQHIAPKLGMERGKPHRVSSTCDTVLQEVYCAAVRELGPMVYPRFDIKIAVTPTALDTLDDTVCLLTLILEKEEFSSGTGHAISANRGKGHEKRNQRKLPHASKENRKNSKTLTTACAKGDELCTMCSSKPINGGHSIGDFTACESAHVGSVPQTLILTSTPRITAPRSLRHIARSLSQFSPGDFTALQLRQEQSARGLAAALTPLIRPCHMWKLSSLSPQRVSQSPTPEAAAPADKHANTWPHFCPHAPMLLHGPAGQRATGGKSTAPPASNWIVVVAEMTYWGTPAADNPKQSISMLSGSRLCAALAVSLLSAMLTLGFTSSGSGCLLSFLVLGASAFHDPGASIILPVIHLLMTMACYLLLHITYATRRLTNIFRWLQAIRGRRGRGDVLLTYVQQRGFRRRGDMFSRDLRSLPIAYILRVPSVDLVMKPSRALRNRVELYSWSCIIYVGLWMMELVFSTVSGICSCSTLVEEITDSGCTWHVHNMLDDLSDASPSPCSDVVVDAGGKRIQCTYTLISVDQLWWFASQIDTFFRDVCQLIFKKNVFPDGSALNLPFYCQNCSFRCEPLDCVDLSLSLHRRSDALKSGIHSAGSQSHVSAMAGSRPRSP
ncbi:MAG: hypothetical protein SGPRY_000215 [Prymnesium sp.]